MPKCSAKRRDGKPCQGNALTGQKYCRVHRKLEKRNYPFVSGVRRTKASIISIIMVGAAFVTILAYLGINPEPDTVSQLTGPPSSPPLQDTTGQGIEDEEVPASTTEEKLKGDLPFPEPISNKSPRFHTIIFEKAWSWTDIELVLDGEPALLTTGSDLGIATVLVEEKEKPIHMVSKRRGEVCANRMVVIRKDTTLRFCQ